MENDNTQDIGYVWDADVLRGILFLYKEGPCDEKDVEELYKIVEPLIRRELRWCAQRIDEVVRSTAIEYIKYAEEGAKNA